MNFQTQNTQSFPILLRIAHIVVTMVMLIVMKLDLNSTTRDIDFDIDEQEYPSRELFAAFHLLL